MIDGEIVFQGDHGIAIHRPLLFFTKDPDHHRNKCDDGDQGERGVKADDGDLGRLGLSYVYL